tara:strand:- start:1457 stop:3193 length:1737 start_codon:yes stop_codon:yes gene_type:complete
MGAFFLYKKNNAISINDVEKKYKLSLDIFNKKKLKLNKKIDTDDFSLFIYQKYSFNVENYYIQDKSNFIVSTGTFFYKNKFGLESLKKIFSDFDNKKNIFNDINGNYCIIIYKKNNLFIFNDYLGLYRVYINKSKNIFSSSFLSLIHSNEKNNVSKQELYEYICYGAFYGDKTIFKEVNLLSSKHIYTIIPKFDKYQKKYFSNNNFSSDNLEKIFKSAYDSNLEYFKMIKNTFNSKVTSALSGGFDSRLMLAISKRVGVKLQLYVYGSNNSKDVEIAKNIVKNENLSIDHVDRNKYLKINKSDYSSMLENNYYHLDGLGVTGIFDNGSDIHTRIRRTKKAFLHINGGGGEIYRNFWELSDKKISIKNFLKSKYDNSDYLIFTNEFNKKSFYLNFEEKIKKILSTNKNILTRKEIEKLYPYLRLKYWMGINNSINNQFSYSLTPFSEPNMFYNSFNIPIRLKNLGRFQAKLIRKMDIDVSKYLSDYGFNFFSKKINLKYKIKDYLRVHCPIFLRGFIRRRKKNNSEMPYFLKEEYIKNIFPLDKLLINQYIDINKIKNPEILSRALTLEFIFQKIKENN